MKNSTQDTARPISGEMIDEMIQIVRSYYDEHKADEHKAYKVRRLPPVVLYCRICEDLFKLPKIICEDADTAKVQPLQSIELHKDAEIWNAMVQVFISAIITCDLIGVGFGEKYDTLSTRTRMNFDGKTIREICYELSRVLPFNDAPTMRDKLLKIFVRQLFELAFFVGIDVLSEEETI